MNAVISVIGKDRVGIIARLANICADNNVNINDKNAAAASLADGTNIFYLDSNPMFTDEEGFLKADLTFDGVHLYANNYEAWKEFFMEHGVVKNDEGSTGNSIK